VRTLRGGPRRTFTELLSFEEVEPRRKKKRKKKKKKKQREDTRTADELPEKPDSYECADCGRKYKEKSHLATHTRAHIDVRNFKCTNCGLLFKTQINLSFHMKTHSEVPLTCEQCNKTFLEKKLLKRHIRVVHR
jgi:uncharacterized Zn-finger protein